MQTKGMIEFGRYIKNHRVAAGLTQAYMAFLLGYKSPQYFSKFETGICYPSEHLFPVFVHEYKMDRYKLLKKFGECKMMDIKDSLVKRFDKAESAYQEITA